MKTKKIAINELHVDATYQRTVQRSHVRRIVENFDAAAFGHLLVAERSSKTSRYYVVDGFHRLEAAKNMGMEHVLCDVFQSKGKAHEAEMFRWANNRRNLDARIAFRCRLVEGEASARAVEAICREHGFHTWDSGSKRANWPMISAVRELELAYDGEVLARVLATISRAYTADTEAALEGWMIGGLAAFYRLHPEAVDDRLITKMKRIQPNEFLRRASQGKGLIGGGRNKLVALALVQEYDKGLKSGRLSDA